LDIALHGMDERPEFHIRMLPLFKRLSQSANQLIATVRFALAVPFHHANIK
jgi:hypothetical protein